MESFFEELDNLGFVSGFGSELESFANFGSQNLEFWREICNGMGPSLSSK